LLAGCVGVLCLAVAGLLVRLPARPEPEHPLPTPVAPGPSPASLATRAQEEELPVPETSISASLEGAAVEPSPQLPAAEPPRAVSVLPAHVDAPRPRPVRVQPTAAVPKPAPRQSSTGRTVLLSADDFK
jgi:hypothetical protein